MIRELRIEKDLEGSDCVRKRFEVLSHYTETCAVSLCSRPQNFSICSTDPQFSDVLFVYAVALHFSAFDDTQGCGSV